MSILLQFFLWIPLIGFLTSTLLPRKKESVISVLTISAVGLHLLGIIIFVINWLFNHSPILNIKHIVLFNSEDIEIFIDFYFDKTTAFFALLGSFITFLVSIFSRYYLHRDEGFKRYFTTILLFFLGYNLIIFSGNFIAVSFRILQ